MKPSNNTVIVNILDKDYQVACPPEQQLGLKQAAKHLDEQMRTIRQSGKVIGVDRISVMAALNLSYETLQLKQTDKAAEAKEDSAPSTETIDVLKKLNNKADAALQRFRQLEIS